MLPGLKGIQSKIPPQAFLNLDKNRTAQLIC